MGARSCHKMSHFFDCSIVFYSNIRSKQNPPILGISIWFNHLAITNDDFPDQTVSFYQILKLRRRCLNLPNLMMMFRTRSNLAITNDVWTPLYTLHPPNLVRLDADDAGQCPSLCELLLEGTQPCSWIGAWRNGTWWRLKNRPKRPKWGFDLTLKHIKTSTLGLNIIFNRPKLRFDENFTFKHMDL